jgi:hypothetical protein
MDGATAMESEEAVGLVILSGASVAASPMEDARPPDSGRGGDVTATALAGREARNGGMTAAAAGASGT